VTTSAFCVYLCVKCEQIAELNSKAQCIIHAQIAVGTADGQRFDTAIVKSVFDKLMCDALVSVFGNDIKVLKNSAFCVVKGRESF